MLPFRRKRTSDFILLPLEKSDLDAAAKIHAQGFKNAWNDGTLDGLVSSKGAKALGAFVKKPGRLGRLTRNGAKLLAGFLIFRIAADEAEIITIATGQRRRKRGVATALIDEMIRQCRADRLSAIFLEVDERNKAAVVLYHSAGFKQISRREAYYKGTKSESSSSNDALVMKLDLSS